MNPTLKKTAEFLAEQGFGEAKIGLVTESEKLIRPGTIYVFTYQGQQVTVICVATRRTRTGLYNSNRGNPLVTCIKLNLDVDDPYSFSTGLILKNILNDPRKAKYNSITEKSGATTRLLSRFFNKFKDKVREKTVMSLFGKSNFRTYNLLKMNNIFKLTL